MAPISIRLCEIMELNPIPILTSMIIFSNIGESHIDETLNRGHCKNSIFR